MSQPTEYKFTADQKTLLYKSIEVVALQEREPIFVEGGNSRGFDAYKIGIEGHNDLPLFMLQSSPSVVSGHSGICYSVLKLGPPPDFEMEEMTPFIELSEAVEKVSSEMANFIRNAKASFGSKVQKIFTDSDKALFSKTSKVMSDLTGCPATLDFRKLTEIGESCAIGLMVNGSNVILASFVGIKAGTKLQCSVRNFQNELIPGKPEYFSEVGEAITAHNDYFMMMGASLRRQMLEKAKPWWKKIF